MSSDINSINVRTNKDVYDVSTDTDTKINAIINNGDAIQSISYTENGKTKNISKKDVEEYLKSLENFGQTIDPTKLSEEMAKKLGTECQAVLSALTAFITQIAKSMELSNEVTPEDVARQNEAQNLIDKLINSKTISDFDIRELMKLLIKAFSELMKSQREITLATINGIMEALHTKIKAMEESRDANYKAAITQAVAQIVSGCIQMFTSIASLACALGKHADTKRFDLTSDQGRLAAQQVAGKYDTFEKFLGLLGSLNNISGNITSMVAAKYQYDAKTADIHSAEADATMEVLRKMQEENSSQLKQLFDFISTLLRTMQELQQSTSSTEKTIVQA